MIRMWSMVSVISLLVACVPLAVRKEQIRYENSVKAYPGDGGAVISNARYEPRDKEADKDLYRWEKRWLRRHQPRDSIKTICVAPPPQAAPNVTFSLKHKGKVNVFDYVEVESENSLETARTLAKLYEQNERTLFLQFSLYRLCEAYMNGMLDEQTYAEVLEQRALAAIEEQQSAVVRVTEIGAEVTKADAVMTQGSTTLAAAKERLKAATRRDELLAPLAGQGIRSAADLRAPAAPLRGDAQRHSGDILDLDAKAGGKSVADAKAEVAQLQAAQQGFTDQKTAAELKAELARTRASALDQTANHLRIIAEKARKQEETERARIATITDGAERARALESLTRKNYMHLFGLVMQTAERLAHTQVEVAQAEAEKAKAEAEKAKSEVTKAANAEATKKLEEELKQLKATLVDAAVKRITKDDSKPVEPPKTTAGN